MTKSTPARPAVLRTIAVATVIAGLVVGTPAIAQAASATPSPAASTASTSVAQPEVEATDDEDATLLPSATRIFELAVGNGTVSGTLRLLSDISPEWYPGPFADVDSVEVTVVSADGETTRTDTLGKVGPFSFSGLPSGLYSVTATTIAASGSSTTGETASAVVPTAPIPASVSLFTYTDTFAIVQVSGGAVLPENLPSGTMTGEIDYDFTLTGGDETWTQTGSIVASGAGGKSSYRFSELTPATTYQLVVTVTNAVGTSEPTFLSFTTEAGPREPRAPGEGQLTDDTRNNLSLLAVPQPGGLAAIQVPAAPIKMQAWLYPGAAPLGEVSSDEAARVWVRLPADLAPGQYRLAITGPAPADGLIGWVDLPVEAAAGTDPVPTATPTPTSTPTVSGASSLAQSGTETPVGALVVGGLLASAGVAILGLRRRRA